MCTFLAMAKMKIFDASITPDYWYLALYVR